MSAINLRIKNTTLTSLLISLFFKLFNTMKQKRTAIRVHAPLVPYATCNRDTHALYIKL